MQNELNYAGDVEPQNAFETLENERESALVDVRTEAEWSFVGIPDLTAAGKEALLVEWQSFPPAGPNPNFVQTVSDHLDKKGLDRNAAIYFLCRSGVRSKAAAIALTQAGYTHCYNISDGFEGPHDEHGHRGTKSGWKVSGLPWKQG